MLMLLYECRHYRLVHVVADRGAHQVGFSLSIKGWVKTSDAFKNAGLDMGSIEGYVGYALAATLVLDVVVLVVAVCSTGRTREVCLRGDGGGKSCGRCCVRFWNTMVRVCAAVPLPTRPVVRTRVPRVGGCAARLTGRFF